MTNEIIKENIDYIIECAKLAKDKIDCKEKVWDLLSKIEDSGEHILRIANENPNDIVIPSDCALPLADKHILIAEDNDITREITCNLLSDRGLNVDSCVNGLECINLVEKNGIDYYTAILMDLIMPVMDGYEAARAIREKFPMHHVPIIAVTASAEPSDRTKSKECGIDAHIAKPINIDALFDAIINAMSHTMSVDILTGVKNRVAYQDADMYYNKLIREERAPAFGIVVFDINDLKKTNDELGHAAGDKLIKASMHLICDTFKHSPVYRFGGDEFATILTNADYENRETLLHSFREQAKQNALGEGPVVASGMSVFNHDSRMSDVFKRADKEMYDNKNELKSIKHIFNA